MNNKIFETNNLVKFFNKIKKLAQTKTFSQWNETENVFLIRHDIDLDLVPALEMAKIEKDCGVTSTFFIMVSNQSYNILSEKNREIINEISNLGFEIGLHFDPTIYSKSTKEKLQDKVRFETSVLENIIKKKIKSISLHKPSIHNNFYMFDDYINTYDKRIFSDKVYLSDSSMNFRGKNPFDFIENVKDRTIQVLLHPLHFGQGNYTEILKQTTLRFAKNIDNEFRVMNPTYKENVAYNVIDKIKF